MASLEGPRGRLGIGADTVRESSDNRAMVPSAEPLPYPVVELQVGSDSTLGCRLSFRKHLSSLHP